MFNFTRRPIFYIAHKIRKLSYNDVRKYDYFVPVPLFSQITIR